MPGNKKSAEKRNSESERLSRGPKNGVCAMCGACAKVLKVEEFDNQPLCASCSEDTVLLVKCLQIGKSRESGLDDELFDDEPII